MPTALQWGTRRTRTPRDPDPEVGARPFPEAMVVSMAVMWWWTVPIGATLTAWFIVLWRSRASVHRDPVITVQRLHRFKGAMARMHDEPDLDSTPASTQLAHRDDPQGRR